MGSLKLRDIVMNKLSTLNNATHNAILVNITEFAIDCFEKLRTSAENLTTVDVSDFSNLKNVLGSMAAEQAKVVVVFRNKLATMYEEVTKSIENNQIRSEIS